MPRPLRIAIHGAAGRMGARLVALTTADDELELAAAIERVDHPRLGEDVGVVIGGSPLGAPLSAELPEAVDAVVDFSTPPGAEAAVSRCLAAELPLVLATTALSEELKQRVHAASAKIPIVWAPNMSLAVNLTLKLARVAAEALRGQSSGVDVEILERHHRFKEDAPSGTALRFGEQIAAAMGQTVARHGREGITGPRTREEIGYHAIRVGDNPGEHTIVFGMLGETIEMTVRASNRDCYALGALAAAKFLAGKQPGMYTMEDVLGL